MRTLSPSLTWRSTLNGPVTISAGRGPLLDLDHQLAGDAGLDLLELELAVLDDVDALFGLGPARRPWASCPWPRTSRTTSAWIGIAVAPSTRPVTMSAVTEKPGRIVSGGWSSRIFTLKLIASELATRASRSGSFFGIGEEPTSVTVPSNLRFGIGVDRERRLLAELDLRDRRLVDHHDGLDLPMSETVMSWVPALFIVPTTVTSPSLIGSDGHDPVERRGDGGLRERVAAGDEVRGGRIHPLLGRGEGRLGACRGSTWPSGSRPRPGSWPGSSAWRARSRSWPARRWRLAASRS